MRQLNVSDPVIFVDQVQVSHHALVTAVHGQTEFEAGGEPSVNLLFVQSNVEKTDSHGQQIERESSVPYQRDQKAHGYYWKFAGE